MTKHSLNFNENAASTESQRVQILNVLLCRGKLTAMDALRFFGCWNLKARINEIRNDGFPVKTTMIDVGEKRVAEYSL